jgi:hypothetical protein
MHLGTYIMSRKLHPPHQPGTSPTPPPANVAPSIVVNCKLIGTPQVGVPMSYTMALVSGSPTPVLTSYRYALNGVDVGTVSTPYVPISADIGKTLTVHELWTNTAGTITSTSVGILVQTSVFLVGANVGMVADYSKETPFVDCLNQYRAFALIGGDSYQSAPLDSNGYPTTDFFVTLPYIPASTVAQVMHAKMLGASDLPVVSIVPSVTISNYSVVGDNMTFDINVPANTASYPTRIQFNNTKRTAGSSTNTGCTGLTIKQPGYTIADTTEFNPLAVAFNTLYSRLRFMDWLAVNGNVTTITPSDRASDTKHITRTVSIEQSCRFANSVGTGKNVWLNIPVAANDALITDIGNAALATLGSNQEAAFQLGNELWNYAPGFTPCHDYAMFQAMTTANGFSGQFNTQGRGIVSGSRSNNVTTITTSIAHGYVVGQSLGLTAIGSYSSARVVVTSAPTSTTFTIADPGVDGALNVTGGASAIVGNCSAAHSCALNSYDNAYDQFTLQKRWCALRTTQMATLLSAVYGGLGTKCKIVYMDAPGNDCSDQMTYINTVIGTPSSYIYGIGNATYYYLNASAYGLGGPNLMDVTTYGSNTPPLISDYINAFTLTSGHSEINDVYDGLAITASTWGLKNWQYEHGPNSNTTGAVPYNAARDTQKQAAMDSSTFAAPYRRPLTDLEGHGFEEVIVYYSGTRDGATGDNTCWPTANTFTSVSTKTTTLDAVIAAPRSGFTRNLVGAATPTIIAGINEKNHYGSIGANTSDLDLTVYLISSQTTRTYSFVMNVAAFSTRSAYLFVNGVNVNTYNFTIATTSTTPVTITLNAGANVITWGKVSGGFIGRQVVINSLSFT